MRTKKPVRKTRVWYGEPQKPEEGSTKYRFDIIGDTNDRYHYFPNVADVKYYEDNEADDLPENTGLLSERQSIPLNEINKLIEKEGMNPEDVFLTAGFADDYLELQVVHRVKLDYSAQLEQYKEEHAEWEAAEERKRQDEARRIQWEIKGLQKRQKELGLDICPSCKQILAWSPSGKYCGNQDCREFHDDPAC